MVAEHPVHIYHIKLHIKREKRTETDGLIRIRIRIHKASSPGHRKTTTETNYVNRAKVRNLHRYGDLVVMEL